MAAPIQNVVPASGPAIHFQVPSLPSSLAAIQALGPLMLDLMKSFSAAEVIVVRYPVAPLSVRPAAPLNAPVHGIPGAATYW